jgi:site-specific DNA-cytosine methylase
MKILVACEYSGVVRDAFRAKGHDAWSCDLLPCEGDPTYHRQENILDGILDEGWDLMIAHPPCTDLAVSGAAWFKEKIADGRQMRALRFVRFLLDAPIPKIALENPVSVISTKIRKPDQIIHPWMFGHPEQKTTCLWLKGLPKLVETDNVKVDMQKLPKNKRERLHYLPPSTERWKERSRTFQGVATAMAEQWGS